MISLRRLHREDGETGHLGEFFLALGALILAGGAAMIIWGYNAAPIGPPGNVITDAVVIGFLFIMGATGIIVFGAYGVFSGWGRHHARFDAGGDRDVPDAYDPMGH